MLSCFLRKTHLEVMKNVESVFNLYLFFWKEYISRDCLAFNRKYMKHKILLLEANDIRY